MNSYKQLRLIRASIAQLPCLRGDIDFDIALEIGYFEQLGTPLTLKQLLLLQIAADATVRRHLDRLVREGVIIKITPARDHRVVHFTLGSEIKGCFDQCLRTIHSTLCENCGECPIANAG